MKKLLEFLKEDDYIHVLAFIVVAEILLLAIWGGSK